MFPRVLALSSLAALCSLATTLRAGEPPLRSPDEVLLLVNRQSPVSLAVGNDYALKRRITRKLEIRCPDSAHDADRETIPYALYRTAIEAPVQAYLARNPGVQFIVLTKGIPIRIEGAETGVREEHSPANTPLNASVDGHLAALGYAEPAARKIQITGSGGTGSGWANRYWNANKPFSHAEFGGYLVTRLDDYTEADAKALVTRALAAEQHPPDGKVLLDLQPEFSIADKTKAPFPIPDKIITAESPFDEYNADLQRAGEELAARGGAVELDISETFIGHRKDLAGYFSWGSNDSKFSPKAYATLFFAPGSIGDTAVSTSARSFLPTEGGQSMIADLIAHGLTCGKGYSDEPLLQAIASPTIALDRYRSGYTMAESLAAASHFVGWEDIIIGDPLCAPYRTKPR
jgi:uncharacterized protein (TIGR03790 family)